MSLPRAVGAALLAVAALVAASPAAATTAPPAGVTVELDQSAVSTDVGGRFEFSSTVHNDSGGELTGMIAHVNILSTDPSTYVDPEDWSSERTQYLDPLAPGESVVLRWRVQAVNSGTSLIYVAVTDERGQAPVAASDGLELSAREQRTINASGVLPVTLGMPAAVLLLMGLGAQRRRRLRR